jgi:hypothetical protein
VKLRLTIVLMLLLGLTGGPAAAGRYHVRSGGLRQSGPSEIGKWLAENCYATLSQAVQSAGFADSVLLYKEDHIVQEPLELTSYLGNQDLDANCISCRVWMQDQARLQVHPDADSSYIAGISFVGGEPYSAQSVLVLDNPRALIRQVFIRDCCFYDNHGGQEATGGSCICAAGEGRSLCLKVSRCLFRQNTTAGFGGAVFIGNGYQVLMEDCEFNQNATRPEGSGRGGALAVYSPLSFSSLDLLHCSFQDNQSQGPGGALSIEDADATLDHCDVSGSRSGLTAWPAGAGLFMRRTVPGVPGQPIQLIVSCCNFVDNIGKVIPADLTGDGGGILVKGYGYDQLITALVEETTFSENYNVSGAGIYVGRYATAVIRHARFLRNTAYQDGGGVKKGGVHYLNRGETARLEYCEFRANRAGYDANGIPTDVSGRGGACMVRHNPRLELINCSFVNNYCGGATTKGDAFFHAAEGVPFTDSLEQCVLINCVFYSDKGNDVQVRSDPDGFSSVSHCAYEEEQFIAPGVAPTNIVILHASPFASESNLRLHVRSPCIDAGMAFGLDRDLIGTVVPQGEGPDIGAYEYPLPIAVADQPGIGPPRLSAYPNPFNPRTTIEFGLDRTGWVRAAVYDLNGRLVAILADGLYQEGPHRVVWSGRDRAGQAIASGVYQLRLEQSGRTQSLKLLLVR